MDTIKQKPKRIQRRLVKGWRKPEGAVNVTRGGKWGNPYTIGKTAAGAWCIRKNGRLIAVHKWATKQIVATECVRRYKKWLINEIAAGRIDLTPLRGKDLMCFCKVGTPCHGDALLEIANGGENE